MNCTLFISPLYFSFLSLLKHLVTFSSYLLRINLRKEYLLVSTFAFLFFILCRCQLRKAPQWPADYSVNLGIVVHSPLAVKQSYDIIRDRAMVEARGQCFLKLITFLTYYLSLYLEGNKVTEVFVVYDLGPSVHLTLQQVIYLQRTHFLTVGCWSVQDMAEVNSVGEVGKRNFLNVSNATRSADDSTTALTQLVIQINKLRKTYPELKILCRLPAEVNTIHLSHSKNDQYSCNMFSNSFLNPPSSSIL